MTISPEASFYILAILSWYCCHVILIWQRFHGYLSFHELIYFLEIKRIKDSALAGNSILKSLKLEYVIIRTNARRRH